MPVTLSHSTQLMILVNFANLILKGLSRANAAQQIAFVYREGAGVRFARRVCALARHYRIFGELPTERCGGLRVNRSWLNDEGVCARVLLHLQSLAPGKVVPAQLQRHINNVIFPALGIAPKKPTSVRTARRWLIKLGWRHSRIHKSVYMDGHERSDVVAYRQDFFLPQMAQFRQRMAKYEGVELTYTPPALNNGEKEVILLFHDECCFQANDQHSHAWLHDGEPPLRKKSRGCLIHVSDFLNPENGRLILRGTSGDIIEDAHKIIYPGSKGDPWWDTEQLLAQVQLAIDIFNHAHPGKIALFIFDNSSAHGSLPPDALKAFEMNMKDGGKRKQHDTIIPIGSPQNGGQAQKMTSNGVNRGLRSILEERGFDLRGLRAKCKPVCSIESQRCCMARLLSQQDDFKNQPSMLETLIRNKGHEFIFLPKFHCELNPIEMVRIYQFIANL